MGHEISFDSPHCQRGRDAFTLYCMEKKTVIIMPNWMGDFIMALPSVLGAVEEEKALLLGPLPFYQLLAGRFPPQVYIPMRKKGQASLLEGSLALLGSPVDKAVLLPNSFKSALMCLLGGVPRTWGLPTDGRGFLLFRKIPPPEKPLHQAQIYRYIIEKAGLLKPWEGPSIFPSQDAQEKVQDLWEREKLEGRKVVVIHPFSSKEPRTWLPSRFKALIHKLVEKAIVPMIVGSPAEKEKAQELTKEIKGPVLDLTFMEVGLGEMAAFIEKAVLFIGNDSGPGHLAAALGIPTLTLHGPTAPHLTGPQGPQCQHLWKAFPCSPCRERFFKECQPGQEKRPPCLEALTLEEVWAAVIKIMGKDL